MFLSLEQKMYDRKLTNLKVGEDVGEDELIVKDLI